MVRLILPTLVCVLLLPPARAMQIEAASGRINVPARVMAGNCITMVSPTYPQGAGDLRENSFVIVHVAISRSGTVFPMRVVSGPSRLQTEAMDAVRQWRYKPFLREGEPLDVTTDVRVEFIPGKPGGMVSHPNH